MFKNLADKVKDNFAKMVANNQPIFLVKFDKEQMWESYLNGFKDADVRQSYNCNNCKSFFRRYAGIVGLNDQMEYITMFDKTSVVIGLDNELSNDGMADAIENVIKYIKSCPVETIPVYEYDPKEVMGGVAVNTSQSTGIKWNHFNIQVPAKYVAQGVQSAASQRGEFTSKATTLNRCFREIKQSDTELLIELIDQGSIYKGTEFRPMLTQFLSEQKVYNALPRHQERYAYLAALTLPVSITNIRNTAIGTLLVDIAEGTDLDTAVRKYEKVVAPTNYKRPTALVTQKMVDEAKEELQNLGLIDSLNRKHAVRADVSVNDLLHTYNPTSVSATDVFADIKTDEVINPRSLTKVEEVSIEDFINKILPTATRVQALVETRHKNNLLSLITAQDRTENKLFKWNNGFSWSYIGGITDSIKERVKAEGGTVDGVLRVSLSWSNSDDLDLHLYEPGGIEIGYSTPYRKDKGNTLSPCGGQLDIDMNATQSGRGFDAVHPVENIIYPTDLRLKDGKYRVEVINYSRRGASNQGYTVQVEFDGQIFEFHNAQNISKNNVVVINYSKANGFSIDGGGDAKLASVKSEKIWGVETYKLQDVTDIMLSPNYWGDNKVGNKHYIFALANCISEDKPRPFFNEFLRSDLDKHRKVFEVLGSKVQIADDPDQLSGLGFSETLRNDIILKVKSKFERYIKVKVTIRQFTPKV